MTTKSPKLRSQVIKDEGFDAQEHTGWFQPSTPAISYVHDNLSTELGVTGLL